MTHPAPEVPARAAADGEVPQGARRVATSAREAGWRVVATYARGYLDAAVRCAGGTAVYVTGGEVADEGWTCPTCMRSGAVTKTGVIRAHQARGADGNAQRDWRVIDSLALRMWRAEPVTQAVAVWHGTRFDFAAIWGIDCPLRAVNVTQLLGAL